MTYPPSLFVYNNPDAIEIKQILKTVNAIKENVEKMKQNEGDDSPGRGNN